MRVQADVPLVPVSSQDFGAGEHRRATVSVTGRVGSAMAGREPQMHAARPNRMTPLVPVSCIAVALLVGGCAGTAASSARAAGGRTTVVSAATRPVNRSTATAGVSERSGATGTRGVGVPRPGPPLNEPLQSCLTQQDPPQVAGTGGVLVDLAPPRAAGRAAQATVPPVAAMLLVRARAGTSAPTPPPTIRPLPNYHQPPAAPPTVSPPGTAPTPRTPINACVETVHTGPPMAATHRQQRR